LMGGN